MKGGCAVHCGDRALNDRLCTPFDNVLMADGRRCKDVKEAKMSCMASPLPSHAFDEMV